MVYYFSGSLTRKMIDMLSKMPEYEPIDVLVSQLDRGSIKNMLEYKSEGLINRLFIDSGAFSFHTGRATLDLEEYISFVNSIDDKIEIFAQVDTIPGKFRQPKSHEDYIESAKLSWENYLYMRRKVKSPHKLTPVFHHGEDFSTLENMLEWRDTDGDWVRYMGLSPANDRSQGDKNIYLDACYDIIEKSSNPDVKTHLYGMTSIPSLYKIPAYSVDSIAHRHISGYNKIKIPKWGVVSITKRSRSSKAKSNQSVELLFDDAAMKDLTDYLDYLGTSLEECQESVHARCAVTMYTIMQEVKDINTKGVVRNKKVKKLF